MKRKINILGTRGIPASHGGFETFAEKLSLHLTSSGWEVSVYCQQETPEHRGPSSWQGINLVHVHTPFKGAIGTMHFDLKCILLTRRTDSLILTLGYNTALFNLIHKIAGVTNIINMDGIEWKRDKWGLFAKAWFWINERAGCLLANHLIADHPEIKKHLETRVSKNKITMIPYGAEDISGAETDILSSYGLQPNNYAIVIARPEPENSILEIIKAFSSKTRHHKLVILGNLDNHNEFHRSLKSSASNEVVFLGAIYEPEIVKTLRYHSSYYLHGHRVGGTNPSLVEAMGASCAVIAHDNHFNRWVAGPGAKYFKSEKECTDLIDRLLDSPEDRVDMKKASHNRFLEKFTWPQVLLKYEQLLTHWYPSKK